MRRDDALKLLARIVPERFPGADTAFLCGSTARDQAKATSDIDLVVVYARLPAGAWRQTDDVEGTLVEAFVHDLDTLRYFLADLDAAAGSATLADMVAGGIKVPGHPGRFSEGARAIARRTIEAGPPPLDAATLDRQRYTISSLADDLSDGRPSHQRLAIASELYSLMATFVLRAAGRWSGTGKGLAIALEAFDQNLAAEFVAAFDALHGGDPSPVQALVDRALAPHGGRLVAGYRAEAPKAWRRTADHATKPAGEATGLIDSQGIVLRWPSKRRERELVLAHLAKQFEPGRTYREAEVNDILNARHTFGDWALLRRELFEAKLLGRDGRTGTYWVPPKADAT